VRQLAAKLVDLLKDDAKLKEQRAKYAAARDRVHAGGAPRAGGGYGYGDSYGASGMPAGMPAGGADRSRYDAQAEEERQLREALELSRREAELEQQRRAQDEQDPDLQAALALSKVDAIPSTNQYQYQADPFGFDSRPPPQSDPFGFDAPPPPAQNDPFGFNPAPR
jgi:hypothetical protein